MINAARLAKQYHNDFLEESWILPILSLFPPSLSPLSSCVLSSPRLSPPCVWTSALFFLVTPQASTTDILTETLGMFWSCFDRLPASPCKQTHTDTRRRMQHAVYYQCMWCTVRGPHGISEIDTELYSWAAAEFTLFSYEEGEDAQTLVLNYLWGAVCNNM